jgi:coproporphyrinogen III oxidase
MKVSNMQSHNGNDIPNQFDIVADNGDRFFQSYNSIIVKRSKGKIYLDENKWDYSVTTGKYRNMYLGETKKETQTKIDSGEYILTDLNI